jgi:hypothetical protein
VNEYDPFWDSHADRERAKHPPPPTNAWDALGRVAFWLAVVVIVWLLCGHPGVSP